MTARAALFERAAFIDDREAPAAGRGEPPFGGGKTSGYGRREGFAAAQDSPLRAPIVKHD